ncbi:MFS transporter, DHA2 family, multidrug resistance protein [Paraburkholderia caballeronis]|uniref:MFS transporter, DHA2 family, multidrug resistance protein n=2 Tax=Paraburkholderia caballeronis TaxID=416943 RepID=A0A1H7QQ77_9BURK|nr:DHA2 family multidrug resistance protein [Paraburkholderia caballeronis]PXW96299.1 DHA2 family multidrug resistance protein [Paraburkholderia caballeronis]RAJ92710.1 DHA2 family multidrug resistance protein [Paraburkholderia caballeronis]SEE00648.1 MFS transporter, DHA2 family, multidrug resistance protein [Paraburkholderia caballeronis]SEL50083.1 MFS transporter, DHA2 family, multidrug resistance protein [Paraburkholderia caballeronis]
MTAVPQAAEAAPLNRGMITLSIMLATLIQTLDSTIANVALPHMQGALSASQDEITWVLTSYIVAAAIATPLTGWLADQMGVKRLLGVAIAGFTVASALCGLSETLGEIVASRLAQGLFGASLVPLSQSILLDINPREKQGQAMAVWGMGVMVGPVLGPTLGGWLTDSYNWRWVFFINVPIGAFALFGVSTFLPAREPLKQIRFDLFGFATLALAIGALQALLDRGEQLDWFNSLEIRIEALVTVISFAFFIVHTATSGPDTFFRYQLLKDRNFATGTFFIFVIGAVLYATRALLPPMLQNLMGYPVATTGLVTAPSGAGTMIAMLIAGRLLRRIDARVLLLFGFLVSAYALWQMMQYTIVLSPSDIVWPGVVQGFGLGFVFVPLSALTFSTLTPQLRADGTATYSLMRNIGSSIGISIVQTFVTRGTQIAHSDLAANVTVFNPAIQPMLADGSRYDMALLNQQITQQAQMIAYLNDFKMMFVATLVVIPLLMLIRPSGGGSADAGHAAMD